MPIAVKCVIYALSLDGLEFRYVGKTRRSSIVRLDEHVRAAVRQVDRNAMEDWIVANRDRVRITVLEACVRDDLTIRERHWIKKLRVDLGYPLFNRTHWWERDQPPRAGKNPHPLTAEQKTEASLRRWATRRARGTDSWAGRRPRKVRVYVPVGDANKAVGPRSAETRARMSAAQQRRRRLEQTTLN